jgi:hypothetical protein
VHAGGEFDFRIGEVARVAEDVHRLPGRSPAFTPLRCNW